MDRPDSTDIKEVDTVESNQQREGDVFTGITDTFSSWMGRIRDTETYFSKTRDMKEDILKLLERMQLDGLINHQDVSEVTYIADMWIRLLNAIRSYNVGCDFVKRDIITYLLELYKMRQLPDSLFIEVCLQL